MAYKEEVKIGTPYSSEEVIVGTWIDGKPLYRKVIECTSPSSLDSNITIYNQLNATMILTKLEGLVKVVTSTYFAQYPINYAIDSSNYITCWRRDLTDIGMRVGRVDRTNCPVTIILEYTKTTD